MLDATPATSQVTTGTNPASSGMNSAPEACGSVPNSREQAIAVADTTAAISTINQVFAGTGRNVRSFMAPG